MTIVLDLVTPYERERMLSKSQLNSIFSLNLNEEISKKGLWAMTNNN